MGKGILKLHTKKIFTDQSILEMKLWEVTLDNKYPDGIKYSLIFLIPSSGEKVLMDNHTPKGHHYHLNSKEFIYEYSGVAKLLEDFKSLIHKHLGVEL